MYLYKKTDMIKTIPDWTSHDNKHEQFIPIGQDVSLSEMNSLEFINAVLANKHMIPRCCFISFGKKKILLWDNAPDMVISDHTTTIDLLDIMSVHSPILQYIYKNLQK